MVYDAKYRPSPISKGGLAIVLDVTFLIAGIKRRYMARLIELITEIMRHRILAVEKRKGN